MFYKRVSKEFIFEKCTEEDIFSHYGVPITNEPFKSPFRKDEHPTCTIKRINGKLLFRDWAIYSNSFDCIDLVKHIYNCDYLEALAHIHDDMKLGKKPIFSDYQSIKEKSGKSKIVCEIQNFTTIDKTYLSAYGLNNLICKIFKVYSLSAVFLNGRLIHRYNKYDPVIGYYFGKSGNDERWKIYFYKRTEGLRFICNTNRIQGWVQIPETASQLIITKSMKDVMTLYRLGYHAIAPQMENFQFYESIIESLKQRFENIHLLYDNDNAGKQYSEKFTKTFDLPHFFMRDEKDVSDYVKAFSLTQAKNYIQHYVEPNFNPRS